MLEEVTLEGAFKIAADYDENDKITVTDLSVMNQVLLGDMML